MGAHRAAAAPARDSGPVLPRAAAGNVDWTLWCIDGSHVRAHRHVADAGGKLPPGEPADHALGRSRGGFTTKLRLVTDGRGVPFAVALSAGQGHESRYATTVLDAVCVSSPTAGRPRCRPAAVVGDKGYSYPAFRAWLRRFGVRAVIPERRDRVEQRAHRRGRTPAFDRAAYRQRHVIENCIGWLKETRAVATRFEKLAIHYLGLLKLGMIRVLLRRLPRADEP